jgi:HlyD family secretion protein
MTVIVGTYVSGVIQSLNCDYNTQVKQGQLCAKIDPRPFQTVVDQQRANLAEARAQLQKDRASLQYLTAVYTRNAKLVETNAVSKDAYDAAKSQFEQGEAQIQLDEAIISQRQAQLATAEVNLGYTDIVSPVDGVVVSRNVTVGQTVAASFQTPTLFLIATDLTKMQVDANVSESDIGQIRGGNPAFFTVDAFPRRTFEGVVTQVRQSPQTVQNVVTYDVVIASDNRDLALKPGMTASTRIVVDSRDNVKRIPLGALRFRPRNVERAGSQDAGQSNIWILRDGAVSPLNVMVGLTDDRNAEIAGSELRDDDAVIVGEADADTKARAAARPTFRLFP